MKKAAMLAPRDKSSDKDFVLAGLRSISRNMKHIDSVIETAGIALNRGLISPSAAINMANSVAPGCFELFLQDVEAAEIGSGYMQEAAE